MHAVYHVHFWFPWRPKEDSGSFETGVADGWNHHGDAGKQTQVLWNICNTGNSQCYYHWAISPVPPYIQRQGISQNQELHVSLPLAGQWPQGYSEVSL